MATTYTWPGTNQTASSTSHAPIKLGLKSNYGEIRPEAPKTGTIWLKNGTGEGEYISLTSRVQRGMTGWLVPILDPNPVKDMYIFKGMSQTILTKTLDDGTVIQLPFFFTTTGMCPITDDLAKVPAGGTSYVDQAFMRHMGIFYHDDGTERWSELTKGTIIPSTD